VLLTYLVPFKQHVFQYFSHFVKHFSKALWLHQRSHFYSGARAGAILGAEALAK
jgi:hypothetical protein